MVLKPVCVNLVVTSDLCGNCCLATVHDVDLFSHHLCNKGFELCIQFTSKLAHSHTHTHPVYICIFFNGLSDLAVVLF